MRERSVLRIRLSLSLYSAVGSRARALELAHGQGTEDNRSQKLYYTNQVKCLLLALLLLKLEHLLDDLLLLDQESSDDSGLHVRSRENASVWAVDGAVLLVGEVLGSWWWREGNKERSER